jgi:superfamily I DNA/RNA helicase
VDLEDELAKRQIPYQVVGSKGFWARSEVLQLLAYLQLGEDPDDREAFARALMAPSRYLGRAFVDAAAKLADEKGWPVTEACGHVISYSSRRMHPGQLDAAADFTSLVHSLASLPPGPALERVLQKTEFRSWLRRDQGSSDGADDNKDDVLSKLVSVADMFDSRAALLEHAEKMAARSSSGSKPDPKKVQLLTVHRAKGLEWPVVFVAGFSDGLLPHYKGNPDEERRLAYVAMTRARDQLTLVAPLSTFRGDTSISPFAFDAGLVTPPGEVA